MDDGDSQCDDKDEDTDDENNVEMKVAEAFNVADNNKIKFISSHYFIFIVELIACIWTN